MKTKSLILIITILGFLSESHAQQNFIYTYDDAGNRIKREYIGLGPCKTDTTANDDSTTVADTTAITDTTASADNDSINNEQAQEKNEPYKDNIGDIEIKLFPNPTKELITIELSDFDNSSNTLLTVFDLSGKMLYKRKNLSETNIVDFSRQANGNYIIRMIINDKQKEWRVIKY